MVPPTEPKMIVPTSPYPAATRTADPYALPGNFLDTSRRPRARAERACLTIYVLTRKPSVRRRVQLANSATPAGLRTRLASSNDSSFLRSSPHGRQSALRSSSTARVVGVGVVAVPRHTGSPSWASRSEPKPPTRHDPGGPGHFGCPASPSYRTLRSSPRRFVYHGGRQHYRTVRSPLPFRPVAVGVTSLSLGEGYQFMGPPTGPPRGQSLYTRTKIGRAGAAARWILR